MKKIVDVNEAENEQTGAPASRWVPPRLTRMSAGSAEVAPNPRSDANGEFS